MLCPFSYLPYTDFECASAIVKEFFINLSFLHLSYLRDNEFISNSRRICECSNNAARQGYEYFALRKWGATCVGIETLDKLESDKHCEDGEFNKCPAGESQRCTGYKGADFIYRVGKAQFLHY